MRALFMDFVNDKQTWNVNDEYMFGKAFLVAPVLHAQYTPEVQQKTLEENEGWNRDSKKSAKHLYLLTLPIPRTWKSICLPVPGGITSGLMKP
jgi:alpha-D-xyloside xylohydrolase